MTPEMSNDVEPEDGFPEELMDLKHLFEQPDYNEKAKETQFHTFIEFEDKLPQHISTRGYPVPFAMKERADQQMKELVEQGIVEEVHG